MLFSELPRKPSCVIDATRFGLSADLPTCQGFVTNDVPEDLRAFVPQIDSNYVFSENAYRTVAAWLEHGADCPLFVSGPAGSGKTSLAMQVAARLSLPVFDFTARLRMDVRELIGRWVMESDGMTFRDGPAVHAWRSGGIFLVNEFSAAPPEAWVSANSLLERLPIFIPETGELVEPHPMTRIIATDNTRGLSNDQDAGYLGRSLQDRSVMDRTWNLRLEGLSWEEEKRLLLATVPVNFPRIPDVVARRAAELWLEIAADAEKASGETELGFESAMPKIGHRVLQRLLTLTFVQLSGGFPPVRDEASAVRAVETIARIAFAETLDDIARGAFLQLAVQRWGSRMLDLTKEVG